MRNLGRPFWALIIVSSAVLWSAPIAVAQGLQHAGQISNVVPIANLQHLTQVAPASTGMGVSWGDVVNTGRLARVRVSLDDGSVLNVGSESNLTITKHDGAAQQTELELNYGRVRAKAVKQTKPGASFQIRTPTGVAGVVGTDFVLIFENFMTRLVVLEGTVRFCTLSGECVMVGAGMTSEIRGNNQPPDAPTQAPSVEVVQANASTSISGASGMTTVAATHGALLSSTMAVAVAVPVAVARGVAQSSTCGCNSFTGPGTKASGIGRKKR